MFVFFENIQKPNSYNDSPITSLSFMRHDVSLESEGRSHEAVPDLQSPTTMHHHHFGDPTGQADLNNNNNNGTVPVHQHQQNQQQHNYNRPQCRSFDSDSISVVEDDNAKEIFAKVMTIYIACLGTLIAYHNYGSFN